MRLDMKAINVFLPPGIISAGAFVICMLFATQAMAASADRWVVGGNDKTVTHNCHGGKAVIDGNRNRLTLTECATVEVNGNNNVIAAAAPDILSVLGNKNEITWSKKADGADPGISDLGTGNKIQEKKP
jgi:hypothetical protein